MPKNKISDYSQTPIGNEDVGNIGITGSAPVSNIDDALQTIMAHLADMNQGASPLDDTFTLSSTVSGKGSFRFDASQVGNSTTQVLTVPNASGVILTDTTLLDEVGKISADVTGNAATADNADKLDGLPASHYLAAANLTGIILDANLPATIASDITGNAATADNAYRLSGKRGGFYRDASNLNAGEIPSERLPDVISDSAQDALDGKANLVDGLLDLSQLPIGFGAPAGAVMHFAMNSAPTGWLKADGIAISRLTYADLFLAIGTSYGAGNETTTFNLPDLRGEFIRGFDDGRGIDSRRGFGSAQDDKFKAHLHHVFSNQIVNESGDISASTSVAKIATRTGSTYQSYYNRPGTVDASVGQSSKVGSSETRPRNIALLACIKY